MGSDESQRRVYPAFNKLRSNKSSQDDTSDSKACVDEEKYLPCNCNDHRGCCNLHGSIRTPVPCREVSQNVSHGTSHNAPHGDLHTNSENQWKSAAAILKRMVEPVRKSFNFSKAAVMDDEYTPLLGVSWEATMGDGSEDKTIMSEVFEEKTTMGEEKQSYQPSNHTGGFHSAHTLKPIHHSVQYHLALDHLDCIRRRQKLAPVARTTFIEELSIRGSLRGSRAYDSDWDSEIYYTKQGIFLQRHKVECISSASQDKPLRLYGCPHQSFEITTLVVTGSSGSRSAQASIRNHPRRCPTHASETWKSADGSFTQLVSCTVCHSVAECEIEVQERRLVVVRYTCYRDLGTGDKTNLRQPKWRLLLTGEKEDDGEDDLKDEDEEDLGKGKDDDLCRRWRGHEFGVYIRVWLTAYNLQRPGLRHVVHKTSDGPFKVISFRQIK